MMMREIVQRQPSEHTCFVYGSFNGNGAQLGGWYCRQAAFEGAHWGADCADNDDFLKPGMENLHYCVQSKHLIVILI